MGSKIWGLSGAQKVSKALGLILVIFFLEQKNAFPGLEFIKVHWAQKVSSEYIVSGHIALDFKILRI